jgi:hypothetical protein
LAIQTVKRGPSPLRPLGRRVKSLLQIPSIDGLGAAFRDWCGLALPQGSDDQHIQVSLSWLAYAQDAAPDAGISRGYTLRRGYGAAQVGWQASSPSTSAYAASSFMEAASQLGDTALLERATRVLHWLSQVQMEMGALPSGTIEAVPVLLFSIPVVP